MACFLAGVRTQQQAGQPVNIPVGRIFMLYKVVLTFESVDETLQSLCEHLNKSYLKAVLFCVAVYYAVQVVLTLKSLKSVCNFSANQTRGFQTMYGKLKTRQNAF